jgi:DNA-binding response OmpR family regulator
VTKVILHVEDEETDVFLFKRAMTKTGHDVLIQVATNGRMAIDYFKGTDDFANRSEFPLPHLVLLDLKLPYVHGFGVIKWIRQEAALSTPVVILSSSENEADIATAYELGANAYLVKPSDTSQFLDIANTINEFWLVNDGGYPGTMRNGTSRNSPVNLR